MAVKTTRACFNLAIMIIDLRVDIEGWFPKKLRAVASVGSGFSGYKMSTFMCYANDAIDTIVSLNFGLVCTCSRAFFFHKILLSQLKNIFV